MLEPPMPGASLLQKYASTSLNESPASSSAPLAHSACICATDLSVTLRAGCSYIPAIYAFPLRLMKLSGHIINVWTVRQSIHGMLGLRPCTGVKDGCSLGSASIKASGVQPPFLFTYRSGLDWLKSMT